MECRVCGRPIETANGICACSPRNYVLNAEPGKLSITGHPVGFVIEGPPESPDGRRVESNPASGGRSYSDRNQDGDFTVELSGSLNTGRTNEEHVLKVLLPALREYGHVASSLAGNRDDLGEDALLEIDGRGVAVQIVSLPVERALWKELSSQGQASRRGTIREAVEMVRQALVHKRDKAAGTLLALDASHMGAIVGPLLVDEYHKAYGDPKQEFALFEAWLVGPTARSCFRLSSPMD